MKSFIYGSLIGAVLISLNAFANQPRDIRHEAKRTTFFGEEYRIYSVRCFDGSRGKISAWEGGRKWCIGTRKGDCAISQMEAARRICS